MDPRERAEELLARARARGSFVVTPDDATSPMDAASTVQIPRIVIAANDPRGSDPESTMVLPQGGRPVRYPQQHPQQRTEQFQQPRQGQQGQGQTQRMPQNQPTQQLPHNPQQPPPYPPQQRTDPHPQQQNWS
ncbi:hypothetical protein [Allokutzneria sp. NRRL B-24872]|uniref:hypothetical protein n=1 Tax=Allokutzneria sp. NRRL B-24872 TaxID=1137961 RepID=UPI000A36C97B|nr:hypothetical protein [Allokutzneria sp. NRRL B-24872]